MTSFGNLVKINSSKDIDLNMHEQAQNPTISDQTQQTLPLAIVSLILGFLSCVMLGIFSAIPAVVFGHIALSRFKRHPSRYKGKRLAIAGVILGYLGIVLSIIVAVKIFIILSDSGSP